jgi:hypothetical protein
MSVIIEIDRAEALAYNEAVYDLHAACDWAREIRDAYELGELELSEEEGRELVEMIRDKVETCERWRTTLYFQPIPVPVAAEAKPEEPAQPPPAVAYARVGPRGIVSYGAPPDATFGNTVLRRGDWHGR